MRKGEESKKKILDAAERLFSDRGYAGTSVQDVLDALGISKGAFYHYFETKMDLLADICSRRAQEWYAQGIAAVRALRGARSESAGPVEKLNAALKLVSALDRQPPSLTGAMAELTITAQDASARSQLRKITLDMLTPLVEEILDQGARERQFVVKRVGEVARLITMLALDVNEEAMRMIAQRYQSPDCAAGVLELLSAYRETIEGIVNAPYGSIVLFDFEEMFSAVGRAIQALSGTAGKN